MKARDKITHAEVAAAVQRFLRRGGEIDRLPEQRYRPARAVGEDKYEAYEPLATLSAYATPGEPAS